MKLKVLIIIAAAMFIAGIIGCVWALSAPEKNAVRIKSGGKVLYTLDLSREENRVFEIKTDKGLNAVEIRDGKIRVKSADCPDQTCVKMGWLDSAAMPVVCLPHGLIIEYADSDSGVDAITE